MEGVLYLGDWNVDGIQDVMWYRSSTGDNRWYVNDSDMSFTRTDNPIPPQLIDGGGGLIHLGDWNGDGLKDILHYNVILGRNRWFINRGDMSFHWVENPIPPGDLDVTGKLYVGDWNGDGLQDIVHHNDINGRNRWYVHHGDMVFTKTENPVGRGEVDNGGSFRIADWNGDGVSDMLWYRPSFGENRFYVNRNGFSARVTRITNGLGAETAITYTPITDNSIYTKGSSAVYPEIDIQTALSGRDIGGGW